MITNNHYQTLEKISVEFPASIVREGGLTACLTYLDFFATSTQRTAVTTAANCCRNIPEDSFSVIKDVMPILLNVLSSNDQKVVEQGSLCVSRVVESFRYHPSKLEELISTDLLKAVLRLLLPGTTNLVGPSIHTQFLRVLSITAKASPNLSAELFKMNVVETLYQILTGVSPPPEGEDIASKLDSVVIMQALIHRPREQIIETLNVVCELLPSLPQEADAPVGTASRTLGGQSKTEPNEQKKSSNEVRLELLADCKAEVKRFATILFPTLTDAYSSTVNLNVRQKVLSAQLKMLSNLDTAILTDALISVPYASFLAAILSQQDHPSLVYSALQAAELLITRMDDIYRYQFYREGVITEISKIATVTNTEKPSEATENTPSAVTTDNKEHLVEVKKSLDDDDENDSDGNDEDDPDMGDQHDDNDDSDNDSSHGSDVSQHMPNQDLPAALTSMQHIIRERAKKFLEVHEHERSSKTMKKKAANILTSLQTLAHDIENCYMGRGHPADGVALFETLATHFEGDVLESVTSAELLHSEVVRVLLEVFANADEVRANSARSAFLQVFMGRTVAKKPKTVAADSPATPFSVLIHKLQDLLSRSEHFEVVTVHSNSFDGNRISAASMLAKQIRIQLVAADDDAGIPKSFRAVLVSIHAIANLQALDDYLRPRIILSETPRGTGRSRESLLNSALASLAADMGAGGPGAMIAREEARRLALALGGRTLNQPPPPPPPATSGSKSARKSKFSSGAVNTSTPSSSSASQEKSHRSTRQQPAQTESAAQAPPMNDDDLQHALECADEQAMPDSDMDDTAGLDAILGEIEEELDDDETEDDPAAVSLEIANNGKITAMKEDGTRVATPSQTPKSESSRKPSTTTGQQKAAASTPSAPPMSYAAAMQTTPWHIEFTLNDKPISKDTTIYRAVHAATASADEQSNRHIWSAVHTFKFRRVPGPPTPESTSLTQSSNPVEVDPSVIPASLSKHPATSSILQLLNVLHALNANLDDVLAEHSITVKLNAEPLSQFVNTKLTAKLNRQIEEPLIVASNCLPPWSEDLARMYPFLFPFETRHLFLQSTSFGYARNMSRWQSAQTVDESRRDRHRDERPYLGRVQRQKVRIARAKMLESAMRVMELYGTNKSILEVEYFEEVGTGLGPTLEFYSTVSKEFSKKKLKLWRENDATEDEYAFGIHGLFPAPMSDEQALNDNGKKILREFRVLGIFVARSMLDSRIIDISFNPTFFRVGDGSETVAPSLGAVKTVDPQLASSLQLIKKFVAAKRAIDTDSKLSAAQKVSAISAVTVDGVDIGDLGLDFTLPGYETIELIPNGADVSVTIENVDLYLEKVIDMTLSTGVQRQVDAFRAGFTEVFPYSALSAFTPDELVMLFGRNEEDWSIETLADSIKADHGFNMDSKSVRNLLQCMSELSPADQRDFLQFTTGSPKLPIGGMFTVGLHFYIC